MTFSGAALLWGRLGIRGGLASAAIAAILESFCYAGFLRRKRWRGKLF
jgi:hypothetical protein